MPSTLLFGYYHDLLVTKLDTKCITNMYSTGLLTLHEQELILAGHSMHQRKCLLLEDVRHLETKSLIKFCECIEESIPTVAAQLAGMY